VNGQERFGLIAGWGRYPIIVAQSLKSHGLQVHCLGIRDHTDPVLPSLCADYREIGLGKLGQAIRYFRSCGIRRATMAGKIHKVLLFQRFAMWKHLPDWRAVRTFYPHWVSGAKDRKDDTLLLTVIGEFAKDGIHFAPATDFVPELLVKPGNLTGREPSTRQWQDIQFGWHLAREMGRLDVGQSVAVKGRAVLAVEAVEGTDACIRRAGELCPQGGFTLVKVAKPQQDMRFDVPTIGMITVRELVQAGAAVLAVEAEKTILVDEPAVIAYARRHRLTLVAVTEQALLARTRAA
jgi:UDP-2,3-diacylglucosamine hydrolase